VASHCPLTEQTPPMFNFSADRLEPEHGATTSVTRSPSSGCAGARTPARPSTTCGLRASMCTSDRSRTRGHKTGLRPVGASPGRPGTLLDDLFASHWWFSCRTVHFGGMSDTLRLELFKAVRRRPAVAGRTSSRPTSPRRRHDVRPASRSPACPARAVSPRVSRASGSSAFSCSSPSTFKGRSSGAPRRRPRRQRQRCSPRPKRSSASFVNAASVEQPESLMGALEGRR
jgi:hypothetical protein